MSRTKLINHYRVFLLMCLAPAAHGADFFGALKALPVKEMLGSLPNLPSNLALPKDPDGISTSFESAYPANLLMDDFEPNPSEMREPRFDAGGVVISTGFFDLKLESYCLHAGTYQPKPQGSGYLMAPLEGPRAEIIKRILVNSASVPDLRQSQIQSLIWAVLSNAKLDRMSAQQQDSARRLLSAQELYALNGGAAGLIPDRVVQMVLDKANKNVPESYRNMVRTYASLKSRLESGSSTFEELERIAVLNGDPVGGRVVKPGQWMLRPEGYFIRALPSGYAKTRVQIYRPLAPTLVRNAAGALTEVDFNDGYKIKTEYDAKPVHYQDAQTGQTMTYAAIKNIILSRPGGTQKIALKSPILVPSAAGLREPGLTLSFPGGGLFSAAHAAPVTAGEAPAQAAKDIKRVKEVAELVKKYAEEQERAGHPVSQADADRFLEQKLWNDGLKEALKTNDMAGKLGWMTDFTGRMERMGAWLACLLSGKCEDGGNSGQPAVTVPVSGTTAVPANTQQQRLGLSARTYN